MTTMTEMAEIHRQHDSRVPRDGDGEFPQDIRGSEVIERRGEASMLTFLFIAD